MRRISSIIRIFSAAAFILFFAAACKNFLTVQPQGQVIPETVEEFAAIIHNRIRDIEGGGDEYIVGNMETILRLEGCSDDLDANIKAGNNLAVYAGALINKRQSDYRDTWGIIKDCNIVINEIKERDSERAKSVLAAAYSIKAVCYYNMLRDFCEAWDEDLASSQLGLPIVDILDISAKPARAKLSETANYTLELFDKALENKTQEKLFLFTEYVIKAYKAKLLFWMEDWESLIPLCEDIMKNSGYVLTPLAEYEKMINSPDKALGEVIIRSHINNSSDLDWYFSALKNYISTRPASGKLMALFGSEPEKDIRYKACFDSKRFNLKQPEAKVRLSEVVLMLAEAYCHSSQEEKALQLLNDLRKERIEGAAAYTIATLPPLRTGDRIVQDCKGKALTPLLQAIFDERRKELYLEGDRWFELKRNGCPEWWVISNGLKYTTKKYMYTAPIYKGDIELNPELIQNPGYVK